MMKTSRASNIRCTDGFSLIELLTVVGIIGILAAIAIPIYSSFIAKANKTQAVSTLESLPIMMEQHRAETGWLCDDCDNNIGAGDNTDYTFQYTENDYGTPVLTTLTNEYPEFLPKPSSDQGNPVLYHYQVVINVTCAAAGECQETATLTAIPQVNRGAPNDGNIVVTYQ